MAIEVGIFVKVCYGGRALSGSEGEILSCESMGGERENLHSLCGSKTGLSVDGIGAEYHSSKSALAHAQNFTCAGLESSLVPSKLNWLNISDLH